MFRHLFFDPKKFDWTLFGSAVCLAAFGLSALYSTSLAGAGGDGGSVGDFANFWKQAAFVAIGILVALVVSAFNYRLFFGFSKPLYLLGIALLVAVLLFGRTVRGTTGWFGIGGFGVQPIEIVKFFLVVFWAKFFSDYARDRKGMRPIIGSGMALAGVASLVLLQPDLGSAAVLFMVWGALLVLSGARRSHLIAIALALVAAAALSWLFVLKPYQKERVEVFLDPWRDPYGRGYNAAQSIIAVGSGGLAGRGLGFGSQSQLRFLPERQTDFVFASLAEELGFVGVLLVMALFAAFFFRGCRLAAAARDDFTAFLVFGILALFAVEAFVNIGGNLGLMPITGIALPFLSYGGSAVLAKFLMLGVLESVAVRR
jgi:rod shape determining protein RodA